MLLCVCVFVRDDFVVWVVRVARFEEIVYVFIFYFVEFIFFIDDVFEYVFFICDWCVWIFVGWYESGYGFVFVNDVACVWGGDVRYAL